jgi:hypothetical protein
MGCVVCPAPDPAHGPGDSREALLEGDAAGKGLITRMTQIMLRFVGHTPSRMATFGPRIQAAVEQAPREAGLQPGR